MRLIDADALKEFAKEKCSYCTSFIGEENVLAWIDNAPTIEPNELDLDIDYSIEYDKRPDGISNAKVTITRIKPRNIIACEGVDEVDMLERMYAEPSGGLISREDAIEAVCNECEGEHYPRCSQQKYCTEVNGLLALPSAEQGAGRYENAMQKLREMPKYLNGIKAKQIKKVSDDRSTDEPSDDLVSREAVVDTILETNTRLKEQTTINHLIENIDALPSAEPAPVVAYICDRRRCAICNGPDGGCDHTTDIKHAAHFKNVAGQYFERPYMEEDDGNL